jgi:non-ribosomal peptide synthetase component E (peptide arylation enzyme)
MSLTAALKRSRISGSDKTAIAFGDQSWTYAEFDEITDTIAANWWRQAWNQGAESRFIS